MEIHKFLCFFLVFFTCFFSISQCYKFYVGGKDGWVLHPSEDYNHWAGRNRFQINDTLFFRYKRGENSVLIVSEDDYYMCNKTNFITKLEDGDSVFQFDRSGPFFFISGKDDNCENGQRLIVVVLALRHSHAISPAPAPAPEFPSLAPEPAISPVSPSPSPSGIAPILPPALSPAPESQAPVPESPSPVTEAPASSPIIPGTPPPAGSGNSTVPGTSPGSPSDTGNGTTTPATVPAGSSSSSVSPSKVLVLSVTILLSVAFSRVY